VLYRQRRSVQSDEERTALLEACAQSAWPPLRTLVLLAITTGARKGELTQLKWADIDVKKGRALVRETKNDEPRTLPLPGSALEAPRELKLNNSARSERVCAALRAPRAVRAFSTRIGMPRLELRALIRTPSQGRYAGWRCWSTDRRQVRSKPEA
jgi:integrase